MRGGFDYNRLPLIEKMLMKLLRWKIKKKGRGEELTAEETGILTVFDKQVDFTRENNIADIIEYIID